MMDKIRSALSHISSDDRDTWVMMAMSVKSELGESGFCIWDEWSQFSEKYKSDSAKSVWRSVRPSGGVTIATLYKTAHEHGWRDDGSFRKATYQEIEENRKKAAQRKAEDEKERTESAQKAAVKAKWIISQCALEQHAYLDAKGFPNIKGLVWRPDDKNNLLCIPMRIDGDVAGLQMIDRDGNKRFLSGQRTRLAEYAIGPSGASLDIWCEGYATGLSIAACVSALKVSAMIHVCFSAGNLKRMANCGLVVADNDESGTGESAAIDAGLPYFMPESGDFNDFYRTTSLFKASQEFGSFIRKNRSTKNQSSVKTEHSENPNTQSVFSEATM